MAKNSSSKKIIKYVHGSFCDFNGNARYFCICAKVNYDMKGMSSIAYGYSLCTPPDEYDQKTAETIARSKVKDSRRVITFPSKMFSEQFIDNVLLTNEKDFVSKHPGAIFKGYSLDEANYHKQCAKKN